MELKDVLKKERTIAIKFQDENLTVTYRVNSITPEFLSGLDNTTSHEVAVGHITRRIVSWDLTEDGKMIPLTREAVSKLPTNLLWTILGGLVDDASQAPGTDLKKG